MSSTIRIIDDIHNVSGQVLADVISALPQWRQDVVMKYKYELGRRESALSFKLLLDILVENEIIREDEARFIEFEIGEHGKPKLKGRNDIHFNLSHCKNAIACAVSDRPIGIDVECIGRYNDGVARYTLSEDELHTLLYYNNGVKREEHEVQVQFTVFWTMKEAVLKLLGTGISDDIKDILNKHSDDVVFETVINEEKRYVYTVAQYR